MESFKFLTQAKNFVAVFIFAFGLEPESISFLKTKYKNLNKGASAKARPSEARIKYYVNS
jgi:hypothetical protein